MSEQLNLLQKLAKIRKMTEVIKKNKKGFNYKYTSVDEILARVTAGMDKYGVSLIPKITPGSEVVLPYHYTKTRATKNGEVYEENINEIITQAGTKLCINVISRSVTTVLCRRFITNIENAARFCGKRNG